MYNKSPTYTTKN